MFLDEKKRRMRSKEPDFKYTTNRDFGGISRTVIFAP